MKLGLQPSAHPSHSSRLFAEGVRLVLAPAVCLFIGFFTADFLLSGLYTWPRTSRTLALTCTVAVLSYEFVFKEQSLRAQGASQERGVKAVVYSCVVPYLLGVLALVGLAGLGA